VTICGFAACKLKLLASAQRYHALVPGDRRAMIAQICLQSGIDLRAGTPTREGPREQTGSPGPPAAGKPAAGPD
jgi:hypothetical protein